MRIPDHNIFMMAKKLNNKAFSTIPSGFHLRNLRENELDLWKTFPFDKTRL